MTIFGIIEILQKHALPCSSLAAAARVAVTAAGGVDT